MLWLAPGEYNAAICGDMIGVGVGVGGKDIAIRYSGTPSDDNVAGIVKEHTYDGQSSNKTIITYIHDDLAPEIKTTVGKYPYATFPEKIVIGEAPLRVIIKAITLLPSLRTRNWCYQGLWLYLLTSLDLPHQYDINLQRRIFMYTHI